MSVQLLQLIAIWQPIRNRSVKIQLALWQDEYPPSTMSLRLGLEYLAYIAGILPELKKASIPGALDTVIVKQHIVGTNHTPVSKAKCRSREVSPYPRGC